MHLSLSESSDNEAIVAGLCIIPRRYKIIQTYIPHEGSFATSCSSPASSRLKFAPQDLFAFVLTYPFITPYKSSSMQSCRHSGVNASVMVMLESSNASRRFCMISGVAIVQMLLYFVAM